MDDFTAKPGSPNAYGLLQSENNAIEPGKRPLSAMSPTIVSEGGKLRLVVGTPGGPTIISSVLQTILDVLDFGMNAQQAVDYPRFHHQWMPDLLYMESYGFSPDTIDALRRKGHKISFGRAMGQVYGHRGRGGIPGRRRGFPVRGNRGRLLTARIVETPADNVSEAIQPVDFLEKYGTDPAPMPLADAKRYTAALASRALREFFGRQLPAAAAAASGFLQPLRLLPLGRRT